MPGINGISAATPPATPEGAAHGSMGSFKFDITPVPPPGASPSSKNTPSSGNGRPVQQTQQLQLGLGDMKALLARRRALENELEVLGRAKAASLQQSLSLATTLASQLVKSLQGPLVVGPLRKLISAGAADGAAEGSILEDMDRVLLILGTAESPGEGQHLIM